MTKKHLIFIALTLLVLTLTVALSGCGREEANLDGKNIAVFELNGGTLDIKTSSVDTRINFAYEPGTYILDPSKIPGYELYRSDYVFTGWYTSPDCNPNEKWDFDSTTFDTETLTLYAGWEKAIVFTYTLYYTDGDEDIELGKYTVSKDAKFDDWRKFANNRENYTPIGYYSDRELTTPWDSTTGHPGGETDTDVRVYVNYLEGKWTLVDDYNKLRQAVNGGQNVYLMKDIDCAGQELTFSGTYTGIFEGNGYTVSNFTVAKTGGSLIPVCTLFAELGEDSVIRNVTFSNVTYELFGIAPNVREVKVSALATNATGATVSNVTIEGKLTTDYTGELTSLLSPFYEEDSTADVSEFTANISIEQQTQ